MSTDEIDEDLEQLVVEVLREADADAATPQTIKGLLAEHENVRPGVEDVRSKAAQLVEEGRLEPVEGDGEQPQYRLADEQE